MSNKSPDSAASDRRYTVTRVNVQPHDGSLWIPPTCPFCGRVMGMHRAPFDLGGIPTYMCAEHGNADMVFSIASSPGRPADYAIKVTADPVHHYEGGTAVVLI